MPAPGLLEPVVPRVDEPVEPDAPAVEPMPDVMLAFARMKRSAVLPLVPVVPLEVLVEDELASARWTQPVMVIVELLRSFCDVVDDVEPVVVFCAATPALAQNAATPTNHVAFMSMPPQILRSPAGLQS